MDPFNLMRMARLFAPGPAPSVDFSQPPIQIPQTPEMDDNTFMTNRLRELYQPETFATDAYNQHLSQMPQYELPGKGRRFLAALAGFGAGIQNPAMGVQVGEAVRDAPFIQRMNNWEARGKALEPAMTAERYANVNNRMLATETVRNELANRKLTETERKNREDEKIRQDRARVYRFKAENPDYKVVIPNGGTVKLVHPRTGQTIDTGIDSGRMTEEDKLEAQQSNALARIEATGAQTRETNAERPNWSLVQDPVSGKTFRVDAANKVAEEIELPVGVTRIPSKSGKDQSNELLPTQEKVKVFNRAQAIAAKYPQLAKYISLEPGNIVRLAEPGRWSGISQEDYNTIYNEIFGAGSNQSVAENTSKDAKLGTTPGAGSITPKTKGAVPPKESRKVGDTHEFSHGGIGRWNGTSWDIVSPPTKR